MFHEWNLYFYYDTEFRSEEQGFRYIMNHLYYEGQSNLNKQIKMILKLFIMIFFQPQIKSKSIKLTTLHLQHYP